jgi:hypothetical protein
LRGRFALLELLQSKMIVDERLSEAKMLVIEDSR